MSNIYIQEPPTNGKVLLETTVGDIEIELWSKETPRACRNFVQLCMEGYYNNTIFHRIIKGFIAQSGDPTGTGTGGDSIYGKSFKDEFHSRLRFTRRGLVGMANSGVHTNDSQFFFTFDSAPELSSKHTLFGKVVGDTIYNMLKLENVETNEEDRPVYPPKILKTKILVDPFKDIVPREVKNVETPAIEDDSITQPTKATKNFNLLSFGSDAEEEEEETTKVIKDIKGKSKSIHDLSNDPHLSSLPALDEEDMQLYEDPVVKPASPAVENKPEVHESKPQLTKTEELNLEALRLKRELIKNKKAAAIVATEPTEKSEIETPTATVGDFVSEYESQVIKYREIKKTRPNGDAREAETMALLNKFKGRLDLIKAEDHEETEIAEDAPFTLAWLNHKLDFSASGAPSSKVIDVNVYDAERYKIHDPRNPINKRKRQAPDNKALKTRR